MAEAADRETALWVVRRLRDAGHQALFAGGCVRDMLLGRPCTDYDVATDATPRQVKRLFGHVLLVGAKFGVAMVIRRRRRIEVATFRSDLSYSDGRRPDGVRFATPAEDARRRDFTINGMFYDPVAEEVIDYVGGREDLDRRLLRTIGSPDERFAEDYLRMVRAARFAVKLGFAIDPPTAEAARRHAARIAEISGERVFDELGKMLADDSAADALRRLDELGLARHLLAELFDPRDLWHAAVARVEAVADARDLALALAALLCDLPKRAISRIIRRWGGANRLRDAVTWLAGARDAWRELGRMSLARFRRLAGSEHFDRLRALWLVRCRLAGEDAEALVRAVSDRLAEIPGGVPLPDPLLTGEDLLARGIEPGPRLGELLGAAYDAQLNLRLTTREEALAWLERAPGP